MSYAQYRSLPFAQRVETALVDDHLHVAIERATSKLRSGRGAAFANLEHAEAVRDAARAAKLRALARLDENLLRFEESLHQNGVQVHWALDAEQCKKIVLDIARRHQVKSVVKGKSMVTEEIHLNDALIAEGIEVLETDLGEYIVQLAQDRPSHIIMPIIHMTREDVGELFQKKLSIPYTSEPKELCAVAREKLRRNFVRADMGISGGNFGVVETGTICLVSNEGNIRMCTTLPRVHVAILGIEKLVPTLADLDPFIKVLARSGTGQKITVYTSLIQGPRKSKDEDGPDEVHVVLIDNGRTSTLMGETAEMLACIRCGACLNACPVYQQIGGHAYGDIYPGPMGSVLTPTLRGLAPWQELPQASSLCGACRDVCPVRIDIPRMLLHLRERSHLDKRSNPLWVRLAMKAFAALATRPRLFEGAARAAALWLRLQSKDGFVTRGLGQVRRWTRHRDLPVPASQTFKKWWQEHREGRR